jgi:hypothetical protein
VEFTRLFRLNHAVLEGAEIGSKVTVGICHRREGLDLYFAFMQLLEEGASSTAEHTQVYDEDYWEDFAVWIDPESTSVA